MPKLVLKYEDRVLREIPIGEYAVTIGRLPNNTVALDNPAVSSRHARVAIEAGQYIVEDLKSANGTFVNNQLITRHSLRDGDVVQIGKHKLVFQSAGEVEAVASAPSPAAPVQDLGGTVFLDTKAQKELLAKVAAQAAAEIPLPEAARRALEARAKLGVLTVLSGSTDKREYLLEAQTALIGKAPAALVRLKGWFKPKLAAAITRKGNTYVVTPLAGKTQVNNQPLRTRHDLEPGDVLKVSGVTLQFTLKE